MHYSDTFFRSQTAQEGLEVLGGKWNANILRWMLEGPIGSSNIDNLYTLNYDNGPVTYTSPKGIVTTYNNGTYWNVLDDALVRLDEALKYASQYGLKVVVNLAGLSGGLFESKANQDKFVQVWQYVANRYKNSPYPMPFMVTIWLMSRLSTAAGNNGPGLGGFWSGMTWRKRPPKRSMRLI